MRCCWFWSDTLWCLYAWLKDDGPVTVLITSVLFTDESTEHIRTRVDVCRRLEPAVGNWLAVCCWDDILVNQDLLSSTEHTLTTVDVCCRLEPAVGNWLAVCCWDDILVNQDLLSSTEHTLTTVDVCRRLEPAVGNVLAVCCWDDILVNQDLLSSTEHISTAVGACTRLEPAVSNLLFVCCWDDTSDPVWGCALSINGVYKPYDNVGVPQTPDNAGEGSDIRPLPTYVTLAVLLPRHSAPNMAIFCKCPASMGHASKLSFVCFCSFGFFTTPSWSLLISTLLLLMPVSISDTCDTLTSSDAQAFFAGSFNTGIRLLTCGLVTVSLKPPHYQHANKRLTGL